MNDTFEGSDYVEQLDCKRLKTQLDRVRESMVCGTWRTLSEIEAITGDPSASISAQLRHLRKPRFGSWRVEKQRRGDPSNGLFEYRILKPVGAVNVEQIKFEDLF